MSYTSVFTVFYIKNVARTIPVIGFPESYFEANRIAVDAHENSARMCAKGVLAWIVEPYRVDFECFLYPDFQRTMVIEMRDVPFFGVIADPRSYINIFYLLLAFPLGIAYFVFLVTGISVGVGLAIIWVGLPILVLVLGVSWLLCNLERTLAVYLLKEEIDPISHEDIFGPAKVGETNLSTVERVLVGAWRVFKARVTDRVTWTGIFYLFLKFPLGVASFAIVVTLVSVSAWFVGASFYYWIDPGIDVGIMFIDTPGEAFLLTAIGIVVVFVSLHVINATALVSGWLARIMLGRLN